MRLRVAGAVSLLLLGAAIGRYLFKDSGFGELVEIPSTCSRLDIYILAGQSNMEGGSNTFSAQFSSRVFAFGKDSNWYRAQEPLSMIGKRRSLVARWLQPGKGGAAIAFAQHKLTSESECIGLVMAAYGGSNILSWKKSYKNGSHYNEMIERALAAAHHGSIRGMLFFQGESDAEGRVDSRPEQWGVHFRRFINDVRGDLSMPEMRVVFAQIGITKPPLAEVVKLQQSAIQMRNVRMIKTDHLPMQDNAHFTWEGYQQLGKLFAEAM